VIPQVNENGCKIYGQIGEEYAMKLYWVWSAMKIENFPVQLAIFDIF
jgi:hypothetical protein